MTAGPPIEYPAVFEQYLAKVVATADPTGAQVKLPEHPHPVIAPRDLERALNNPRVLFPPELSDPREQLRLLCRFALWLRYSPPGHVPRRLASRAARMRFAVWTLPPRTGWQQWRVLTLEWSWTGPPGSDDYVKVSWEMVLAEARAARDDWLAHLNSWEDDHWLAGRDQRDPGLLEDDLRWLTTTWPRLRRGAPEWSGDPAYLDLEPDGGDDRSDYHRVATDLAELHWLPRGSLTSATAALLPDQRFARFLPWGFPVAALVVVGLFAGTLVHAAAWVALGLLVGGLLGAVVVPSRLSGLALLRIPAAVAVGQVVLISLTAQWWLAPWGWRVGAGLLVIATLYLVLESRLHGADPAAWLRGPAIAAIGALHAFVLSLVVLAFVAPAVADHGQCLAGWWSNNPWSARTLVGDGCADLGHGHAEAPAGVLVLMTGWSLAVGLAAQILWDDRPVTAPLGRLRRVRGATP
ncbi:MAG: hypothetical protein ACRDS0_11695 [Pseudonocardiaceae bacterium]